MAELQKIEAYSGDGEYIFVSYAHKDRDIVYPFIATLQKKYNVWFDEGIRYGKEWEDEIAYKLKNCSGFVFIITENSLNSQNCKDELYHARNLHKNFLNILTKKDIVLPDWFSFRYGRYQMCNYYEFSSPDDVAADLERKCEWLCAAKAEPEEKAVVQKEAGSANKTPDNNERTPQTKSDKPKSNGTVYKYADASLIKTLSSEQLYDKGSRLLFSDKKYEEEAAEYLSAASDAGNPDAAALLGHCYEIGQGVSKSYDKAFELFEKAVKQGVSLAESGLGDCYFYGNGVSQSYEKAIEWYKKAADHGDLNACNKLSFCYSYGHGVPADKKAAREWMKKFDQNLKKMKK